MANILTFFGINILKGLYGLLQTSSATEYKDNTKETEEREFRNFRDYFESSWTAVLWITLSLTTTFYGLKFLNQARQNQADNKEFIFNLGVLEILLIKPLMKLVPDKDAVKNFIFSASKLAALETLIALPLVIYSLLYALVQTSANQSTLELNDPNTKFDFSNEFANNFTNIMVNSSLSKVTLTVMGMLGLSYTFIPSSRDYLDPLKFILSNDELPSPKLSNETAQALWTTKINQGIQDKQII